MISHHAGTSECVYNDAMRWVFLSPHLDDAVFSAGGWLYEAARSGRRVEIWTVMAGPPRAAALSPFAQLLHGQWGAASGEAAVRMRRSEDREAAAILGAGVRHLDFPDALYRSGPAGEPLYPDVFVEPHPTESGLAGEVAAALADLLAPGDRVVCQFGLGGHVDHLIVRQAAGRLERPLWYAADLPYHFKHPGELERHTADLRASIQPVSEAGLLRWEQAARAYASQLSSVFERQERVGADLRDYCAAWGGLPLWRP